MCGIAGFKDFRKKNSEEILTEMSCAVVHCGSGQGMYNSSSSNTDIPPCLEDIRFSKNIPYLHAVG